MAGQQVPAQVAELVDACVSGAHVGDNVGVRLPPWALEGL